MHGNAQSEEDKEKYLIGSSLSVQYWSVKRQSVRFRIDTFFVIGEMHTTSQYFSLRPHVAKVFNDYFTVGITGALGSYRLNKVHLNDVWESYSIELTKSSILGVGVFTRYNFNPMHSLKCFVQPNINFDLERGQTSQENAEVTRYIIAEVDLGFEIGISYDISSASRILISSQVFNYTYGYSSERQNATYIEFLDGFHARSTYLGFEYTF